MRRSTVEGLRSTGVLFLLLGTALPAACQSSDAAVDRRPSTVDRQSTVDRPAWDVAINRGKYEEAESLLRAAMKTGPDTLVARVRLGDLYAIRGQRAQAEAEYKSAVATYTRSRRLSSRELAAVASSLEALGATDPSRFRDALRVYDDAIAADSSNWDARVALGDLFLDRNNRPEAVTTYNAVIAAQPRHPGALLGRARVGLADGNGAALAMVRQALEFDPEYVDARVVLAMSHLEGEAFDSADAQANKALETNPVSLPALTVLAASHLLRGDTTGYETNRRKVLQLNPGYADFYAQTAEVQARNRFYAEARDYAARGLALDSSSARVLTALGMNELRTGRMNEGRAHLEKAFALDPYSVWVKNTLDLLDATKGYREVKSPRFLFVVAPNEADLLTPYLTELAEIAYDTFAVRYGYKPPPPVRVELYRRHADFSVRTVGLAGLGALGVSFGPVVAMDAPSARPRGEFNFGSTLWHELAHTFTLGTTDHRIPRWFSEGLSVYEERRARTGWGQGLQLSFLAALKQNRLLPVSRLSDGFVRPTYPEQINHAYYQASLVCELVAETRGWQGIRAILDGYRAGGNLEDVYRKALGASPDQFDKEFDAWIRKRFASQLAAIGGGEEDGPFQREMIAGAAFVTAGNKAEAVTRFAKARDLFPEFAEDGGPYEQLAALFLEQGNERAAAEQLTRLTALAETNYDANVQLAALLEKLGDQAGATAALERAAWIDPRDQGLHQKLADMHGARGAWRQAARERAAVLALDPVDRAEALYQLAYAWNKAGDRAAAKREVLKALEIAPSFEKAQQLLLEVR
ncbi:MAG TPA: tetratricopeptide repeat protein [Gemmatimonadales bacterium]|nr:tetratricopeptide repeat protein [Gemmatimonadales bacterium]